MVMLVFSFALQEVYIMHFGNNETLVTQSYCNDYDKQLGYIFTIYQLVVCFALPALVTCWPALHQRRFARSPPPAGGTARAAAQRAARRSHF